MEKRGQVTAFVILGIVIIIVIVLGVAFRKTLFQSAAEAEMQEASSFTEEVDKVQVHIENCVEKSLREAIGYFATSEVESWEDYEQDVADYVANGVQECLEFSRFYGLKITRDGKINTEAFMDGGRTLITAIAEFDVDIERGVNKETLSKFHAEVPLKEQIYTEE